MENQGSLIIFAKSPVAGQVKTRLIPSIGREKATNLYRELLARTLDTAVKTQFTDIQLWISGNIRHRYFSGFKNRNNFKFYQQEGKDLGQRMFNAFDSVLKKHPYAILIGSDCPSLLNSDLKRAMTLLKNGKELVLGPAKDGGYYLIGLRKNNFKLFSEIKWGGESVFSETYSRAKKMKLDIELLSEKRDVDRASDLYSYFRMKRKEIILR